MMNKDYPAAEAEAVTIAQAARQLGTTKQTIRNHMTPGEEIRRQVNGQTWIYLRPATVARIAAELEQRAEKQPQSAEAFAGKALQSTDNLPANDHQSTEKQPQSTEKLPEILRQAREIEWLRDQLEERDRQLAAKDQQIAAAQQLANQAQQLQLIAERRLAAHMEREAAQDAPGGPQPQPDLRDISEQPQAAGKRLRALWSRWRGRRSNDT